MPVAAHSRRAEPESPAPGPSSREGPSPCPRCGFELWIPVGQLRVSHAGLYDDNRFPGRALLALNSHEEDLSALNADVLMAFMADLRDLSRAVKHVTRAARVNVAVLGNAVPHLHWHVIPRRPESEPLPGRSPWNDPRERRALPSGLLGSLREKIGTELLRRKGVEASPHGQCDNERLASRRSGSSLP